MAEKEYETLAEALKDIAPHLGEKERKKQLEIIENSLLKGIPIKDTLKISADMLEFMYSQAYRLYMTQKYDEANRFFQMLYSFNPQDTRYSFGVAACNHMQNKFEESVAWYLLSALIDSESPLPYYHISDCFLKQGDNEGALYFLYKTLNRIGDDSKYATLKERVLRMTGPLEEKIESQMPGVKKQ